jgi:hypothetical protein
MFLMNKKALSDVVTTVLIILLSLAAVAVLWAFISPFFRSSGENVNANFLTTTATVEKATLVDGVAANVVIKAGQNPINGIKIVLTDSTGRTQSYENITNIGSLENKVFSIPLTLNPVKIEAYPILTIDGTAKTISSMSSVNANQIATESKNLLAHYSFNGDLSDSSGNGNTLKVIGSISYLEGSGRNGKVANFDGKSGLNGSTISGLRGSNAITYSAWIKPSANIIGGSLSGAVITANPVQYEFALVPYNNGSFGAFMTSATGDRYALGNRIYSSYYVGYWNHVVGTYNKNDGSMKFYLNGYQNSSASISSDSIDATGIYLGFVSGVANFTGQMDDVRIYNKELSASEIATLYNLG